MVTPSPDPLHFYPVHRESRIRRKPFPVNNMIFSTRCKKPPPGGSTTLQPFCPFPPPSASQTLATLALGWRNCVHRISTEKYGGHIVRNLLMVSSPTFNPARREYAQRSCAISKGEPCAIQPYVS